MNHHVHSPEQRGLDRLSQLELMVRDAYPLPVRNLPDQRDHLPIVGQVVLGECGSDEPTGAGDQDGPRLKHRAAR